MASVAGPFFPWETSAFDAGLALWIAGPLALLGFAAFAAHRLRLRRRALRQQILGLRNGPRFRVVDAMCHAAWRAGKLDEDRLTRALEISRGTTGMDLTRAHLREAALRVDRAVLPLGFRWMRKGLMPEEKLVIFNSAASVLLVDGPLTRPDRVFLRRLARGLGLGRTELRGLRSMIET